MRTRTVVAAAATALLLLTTTTLADAAAATGSGTSPQSPWKRYHQADFTVPAGQACSFAVRAHVLYDREYYRTISKYHNGNPRAELFRGPLIIRFTNRSTGRNAIRNLSGIAIERFNPDKSFHSIVILSGQFSATLPPGSQPAQGIYVVHGRGAKLIANDDGTDTLKLGRHGTAEDLCDVLTPPRGS